MTQTRRGVTVIGYLEAELGLGEAARRLVQALESAGVPTTTITWRRTDSRQAHRFEERSGEAAGGAAIVCVSPGELGLVRRSLGQRVFAGSYTIGLWFWEASRFPPALHEAFPFVDEIWVASEFVRTAISRETHKPVWVAPLPLEPAAEPVVDRAALGLPDDFVFLFSFDFLSLAERKNPVGLVDAFSRAFPPNAGPTLVIKTINGDRRDGELQQLRRAAGNRSDIRIIDGYIDSTERDALMAACDCYVSLHRSEGLGLTMAEAMGYGKPVIATGYSGNLQFMDEHNSYLVRYALTTIPAGCDPYTAGAEWAEPDLDHAAELMRIVYADPAAARAVGERGRADLVERHSRERSGQALRERLETIPGDDAMRAALDKALLSLAQDPGRALAGGGRWSPVAALRRVLRRALWPELVAQRRLQGELIEAIRALERAITEPRSSHDR